jgi:hypothetical protein
LIVLEATVWSDGASESFRTSSMWTISDEVEIRGRQFDGFDGFDWMRPGAVVADKQILLLFPLRMQEREMAGIAASESQIPLLWEAVLEHTYAE